MKRIYKKLALKYNINYSVCLLCDEILLCRGLNTVFLFFFRLRRAVFIRNSFRCHHVTQVSDVDHVIESGCILDVYWNY